MSPHSPFANATSNAERILVIYTGGTIGMQQYADGLAPSGDFALRMAAALTQLSPAQQRALPLYDILSYSTLIDSSAATPLTWQHLAHDINNQLAAYTGFVIIHGTDTLSWTAASLAYQLQGLDRPVVLTGAMQPLEASGGDGLAQRLVTARLKSRPVLTVIGVVFARHPACHGFGQHRLKGFAWVQCFG